MMPGTVGKVRKKGKEGEQQKRGGDEVRRN
jgi:hypothetical protein